MVLAQPLKYDWAITHLYKGFNVRGWHRRIGNKGAASWVCHKGDIPLAQATDYGDVQSDHAGSHAKGGGAGYK